MLLACFSRSLLGPRSPARCPCGSRSSLRATVYVSALFFSIPVAAEPRPDNDLLAQVQNEHVVAGERVCAQRHLCHPHALRSSTMRRHRPSHKRTRSFHLRLQPPAPHVPMCPFGADSLNVNAADQALLSDMPCCPARPVQPVSHKAVWQLPRIMLRDGLVMM